MRLRLIWVGKGRDRLLAAVVERYVQRLERFAPVEVVTVPEARGQGLPAAEARRREARGLRQALEPEVGARRRSQAGSRAVVALDERGQSMTSRQLAEMLAAFARSGRREVAFVIGGDDGLDSGLVGEADRVVCLTRLTLTHELARVLLVEQIYRAHAIMAGHPYHRA